MDRQAHWNHVYETRALDAVSWYQPYPELSLSLIARHASGPAARVIDVGGGTSWLVDLLLGGGYDRPTVLDVSGAALQRARERLGPRAASVRWICADVTTADLEPGTLDVWHDRAVFHFLTAAEERARYVAQAARAVAPDGMLVIATFAEDGPARCSGLEVVRYSPEALAREFASEFSLVESRREAHRTPSGAVQQFVYCVLGRS